MASGPIGIKMASAVRARPGRGIDPVREACAAVLVAMTGLPRVRTLMPQILTRRSPASEGAPSLTCREICPVLLGART
jgi:hypothetical protein